MTENYLSGKKRSLKLGVSGHSENLTSLETVGGVGIGTTNTDKRALYVIGNTEITGVLTASSYSGDGSGLTGVAATDHVASFDLQVAGISTFYDDVRVVRGGIDVSAGVVSATQLDIGTGGIDVDGQADLDELVVAGVSTFSKAIDLNAGIDVDGQADLDEVVVAGAATFTNSLKVDGAVDIGTGGLDVDGETQLDELVVAGVSTFTGNIVAATAEFSGNVTIGGTLTTEDKTNIDSVGLVTARTGVRVTAGGIDVTAGVSTFSDTVKLNGAVDIGTGGVDIDGQTDLDEVVIAGVTTFNQADIVVNTAVGTAITIHAGNIQSVGIITAAKFVGDGSGLANLPGINTEASSVFTDITVTGGANITGVVTAGSYRGDGTNLTGIGTQGPNVSALGLSVAGISTFNDDIRLTAGGINAVGVITATAFSGDGSGLTNVGVDTGTVSTNSLHVLGISTFADDVRITAGGLNVVGVSTFNDNLHLLDNDQLILGTGNDLGIYHNGSGNFIEGTVPFALRGSNVSITRGGTAHSFLEATGGGAVKVYHNGSEKFATTAVGATVYGNSKATTLHVAGVSTLTGNVTFAGSVNQLNVTGVSTFAKAIDLNAGIDVDGQADLDEVVVAGAATFSNTVKIDGALDIGTGGVDIDGQTDLDELVVAGVATFSKNIDLNAGIDVDGQADLDEVVVAGAATFSSSVKIDGAVDIGTGGVDIDGQTDLDELVVAGVSTFSAKAVFNTAYPSIDADNEIQVGTAIQLGKAGVITATSFSGDGSGLTGIAATDHVSTFDLVVAGISTFYNDVKIVGGGSTAGNQITIGATTLNDGTLTFDGTAGQLFSISNNLTDGSIFSVNDVSGMPSIDVGAAGTIQLAPYGAGELVGIGTTRPTSKLDVVGDVQVVGVVTATSFSGSGANLTGITITDGSFIGLNVTGITTLGDDVTITAGGVNVTGVSTFNDNVHLLDSDKLLLGGSAGTHDGLEVYHNGSHSYVNDTGTGNFYIGGSHIWIGNTNQTKPSIEANSSTYTKLYYNGSQKFETTITGAGLAGILTATGINLLAGSGTQLGATGIITAVGANISGVVTATSFSGSGANLTGIAATENVATKTLVVAGVTTFHNAITNSGDFYIKGPAAGDGDMFFEAKSGTTNARYYANSGATFHFAGNERFRVDTLGINVGSSYVAVGATIAMSGQACFAGVSTFGGMLHVGTGITMQANTGIISARKLMLNYGNINTIIGDNAGEDITSGHNNLLIGYKAGDDIQTGAYNVCIGREAGSGASGGAGAVFIGYNAGANWNQSDYQVAIGYEAAYNGGNYGVALGYAALKAQSNAQGNIGIGHRAAEAVTGNHNTVIGRNACYTGVNNLTSGTNNIIIGYNAEASASNVDNQITLGNSDVNQLRLPGIGVSFNTGGNGYFTGIVTAITGSFTNVSAIGGNYTGVLTCVNPSFTNVSAIGGNYTGVVTASSFSGDGSALTGIEAGGTGEFYVGFTSSVTMNANSFEMTGHTFPSTASKTYTIDSIMAANVANVGVGTTVNLIASISSNSGVAAGTTEKTYIAYNVPLAAGGAVELLKEPMVANPNDIVKLWATNDAYVGIASAIQVHMTYTQQDSTDFFGKYASNTSIGSTTIIGIHTAGTTYAAALQSIHLTNRSDAGAFPVDIMLTNSTGVVTTYLVKNLVIPKYSSVEILERPKRMETGSTLGVKVQQTGTIDVVVSGKKYS